jgi:hypothetical protein
MSDLLIVKHSCAFKGVIGVQQVTECKLIEATKVPTESNDETLRGAGAYVCHQFNFGSDCFAAR